MSASASPGLLSSLRQLGDNLLATLQDRLELVSVELQEEKHRLVQAFIWISVAVFTGMMALIFLSLTLVYLFWEQARLGVLLILAVAYALAFLAVVLGFRRHLAREPRPLESTLREIAEDRVCIPPDH